MEPMTPGTLFLIPSTLGEVDPGEVLPVKTLEILRSLNTFIVEEIRSARRFLRKAGFPGDLGTVRFLVFNEHSDSRELPAYLTPLLNGEDTGLLSEAGAPCIADPGAEIVEAARTAGIRVIPLTGPSSVLLALMASGFSGQSFAFHGYLPVGRKERQRRIRELERQAAEYKQTQIFIETPYRNHVLFEALVHTCRPSTRICIAMNLTLARESVRVHAAGEWKTMQIRLPKEPAVFLLAP